MGKHKHSSRKGKIKVLTEKLEKGIRAVFHSDQYKEYLATMAKFHSYSFHNSMLIHLQKPDASLVAGYKTWESLERHVKKGETGITILAPCPYRIGIKRSTSDSKAEESKADMENAEEKEEQEILYTYFRPVTIFDISQTEGRALPVLAEELQGEVSDYEDLMKAVQEIAGIPFRFETWEGTKKGYYNLTEKEIVIKSGMSELQTVKTAIHETAHSILHTDREHLKDPATMEVEAESIAFVVCHHYGLDTADYSFGYLAGWSSNKELPELKSSLQTIQKISDYFIEKMDRLILKNTNHLDISSSIKEESEKISGLDDYSGKHRRRR